MKLFCKHKYKDDSNFGLTANYKIKHKCTKCNKTKYISIGFWFRLYRRLGIIQELSQQESLDILFPKK